MVYPACASDAASLAREVRADARSVKDLYVVVPAHGCMSRGVERNGQMSSPPVFPRGLCGLETAKTARRKKIDGRHRVLKEMIVINLGKEEAELAPLLADGFGPPKGVRLPMENPVYA